jgi:hypothetical protein
MVFDGKPYVIIKIIIEMKRKKIGTHVLLAVVAFLFMGCEKEHQLIDLNQLPQVSQDFIADNFKDEQISYILKDNEVFDRSYEVQFVDRDNIEFSGDGEWEKVSCYEHAVPSGVLGDKISNYVAQNFPNAHVRQIEKEFNNYEVELNNGLELVFDKSFDFVGLND